MTRREAEAAVRALPAEEARELGRAGRAQLVEILAGSWAWSSVMGLPGRHRVARALAGRGWLALWPGHPRGLHATLGRRAIAALDVEIDEFPVVRWETIGTGDDAVTVDVLQVHDRWVSRREREGGYPMPRTRGIAGLPIRGRRRAVEAAEEAPLVDEERTRALARACTERAKVSAERAARAEALRPARALRLRPGERRKILGVFLEVRPLRRGKSSKKKAAKKGKAGRPWPSLPAGPASDGFAAGARA